MGREGLPRPLLERRMALATALTASGCPTTYVGLKVRSTAPFRENMDVRFQPKFFPCARAFPFLWTLIS